MCLVLKQFLALPQVVDILLARFQKSAGVLQVSVDYIRYYDIKTMLFLLFIAILGLSLFH
jgi:hypothetical protein